MDKGNLLLRDALRNQLGANVIIHIEVLAAHFVRQKRIRIRCFFLRSRLAARGGQVAKHQLCQLFRRSFVPDADNVPDAGVDLAARIIRQKRIHQPLVKPQLPPVGGDAQHVVHARINRTAVNRCRPLRKCLHHFLLIGRRLHYHRFVVRGRSGQIQLVSRLDVRNFLEKVHQLREIEELCKARPRPIARPFGLGFVKRFSVIFLNSSGCPQGSPCDFVSTHILEHLFNRLFGSFGLLHAHNKGGFTNLHRITRILIFH